MTEKMSLKYPSPYKEQLLIWIDVADLVLTDRLLIHYLKIQLLELNSDGLINTSFVKLLYYLLVVNVTSLL